MNLLFVDDEPALLEVSKIMINNIDPSINISTVTSAENALEMLNKQVFDVIISDYQMPDINGIDFLKIVRNDNKSDIPFIIFTGRGREEIAMEALNSGANSYFQKGTDVKSQYLLLVDAVKKAVRLNKAEKALREEKENRFRQMVDTIQEGIVILENDKIIYVNSQIKQIYGFSDSDLELLTDNNSNLDDVNEHLKQFKDNLQADNWPSKRELGIKRKNGEKRNVSINYSIFPSQEIEVKYMMVSDITKRKQVEERIKVAYYELDQVFQLVRDGMRIISSEFDILKVSDELLKVMQYEREDVIGTKCYETFPGSTCNTPECPVTQMINGEEKVVHFETKELRNGQLIETLVASSRLEDPADNSIRILEHYKVLTQPIENEGQSKRQKID